jgi:MFS family permease
MMPRLRESIRHASPFQSADARRFAFLFGVVYFAQGMWYLPDQTVTMVLKDRGLSAGQVATFFALPTLPWLIKPVYGLLSDFVPLFGRRRKSYFLLMSGLAAAAGFWVAASPPASSWWLAVLITVMAVGLAFTDVLTDAVMVEAGRPRGLTGVFQSVQWAAIYAAAIVVGLVGGYLAERRALRAAFLLTACFPLVSFVMALRFIREPSAGPERQAFAETWTAIQAALGERDLWIVMGFIFFSTFSPSFGPALLYYQTDRLAFSQQFIGVLAALGSVAAVVGALIYAPLSRRLSLRPLIVLAIGIGVANALAYLVYRDRASALIIDTLFGGVGMITQLAFLDLAARVCPRRVEATVFAALMSVYNGGEKISEIIGAMLYDALGYTPLVLISAALTALAWALVPFVGIERIERRAAMGESRC